MRSPGAILANLASFAGSSADPADLGAASRSDSWSPWFSLFCAVQPTVSAALRSDGEPRWAQDIDVIRTLGLAQIGAEKVVSSAISSVFTLLPFGSRLFRAGLANLILLALAGALIYRLSVRLIGGGAPNFRHGALAAAAALTVTNSAAWQLSSTRVGGAIPAAMLVVLLSWQLRGRTGPSWLVRGLLLGLLLVESQLAFVAGVMWLAADCLVNLRLPRLGSVLLGSAVLSATAAVCLLPSLIEAIGARGLGRMGLSLALPQESHPAFMEVLRDAGYYFLSLALVGFALVVARPRLRCRLLPWVSVAPLYWITLDPALGLLVMMVVGVFASVGVHSLIDALRFSRLPLSAQTFRLASVVHLGALLMLAEDARDALKSREVSGTGEWSEQAFSRLPARSLLITHSPGAAWRLWAERVSGGTRPDVLLVPQALLSHGDMARDLLTAEPALGPVVRDVALDGRAGEYALSTLADTRPVRVEFDPRWDRRLLAHCVPDGLWFRFFPHEMGRSDRAEGLRSVLRALRLVRGAAVHPGGRDADTIERLRSDARQQLLVATELRDRGNARQFLRALRRLQLAPKDSRRFTKAIERNKGLVSLRAH